MTMSVQLVTNAVQIPAHVDVLQCMEQKMWGWRKNAIRNNSAYFDVTNGIPHDIMHDVLEGTLQY
jgi:hypothetical protein